MVGQPEPTHRDIVTTAELCRTGRHRELHINLMVVELSDFFTISSYSHADGNWRLEGVTVIMNVLEVAVFAMVTLGPNQQPFNCEVSVAGVRCSHGVVAFKDGDNGILMSDGIKVIKSPKGALSFSNGIIARMDPVGWVQFSNGVAVRRESSERFRFSTGMVCQFTAMGRAGCAQE